MCYYEKKAGSSVTGWVLCNFWKLLSPPELPFSCPGINMMPPEVVMKLREALEVTAPTGCKAQCQPQLAVSAVAECGLRVQIQAQHTQWLCDL